ncbi:MAG: NADH:flavin oxidoreductase/NADH oxidase family protein [Sandaracinaceae bacterium]
MTSFSQTLTLPNGQRLSNRIAKSAMSERLGDADHAPSEELIRLYERWGRGGAGLLITGNVMIDHAALGESGNVAVDDRRALPALTAWAQAAKADGSKVWMQINHPGRQSPRTLVARPVSASAVPLKGEARLMFARPRALEEDEIEAIIARFATTAAIAEEAGFDGVQIHGAHGYLINQFLSPHTNRRQDAWGGDPERRRRFVLEVVRAIRRTVRPGFSVGLKLNSADFQKGGFDDGESVAVVEALDAEGLDLIEVSGGTYESAKMFEETVPTRDSSRRREAFFQGYVEMVRERVRTPLMLTGGLRTRGGMEHARENGVDVVGLARPIALEPDLPARLLDGSAQAARPVRLATGFRSLDSVIQGSWYQTQIDRMGRGLEPNPKLGRLLPVLRYFRPRRSTRWTPRPAAVQPQPAASARA